MIHLTERAVAVAMIVCFLVACATSPTGRRQLHLLSAGQMDQVGQQSYSEIKKHYPDSKNKKWTHEVHCVVKSLLERNGEHSSEWEVHLFASQEVNAFALPGRKIGVYEGMFKVLQSPDQLAAVLGHEIGHVEAQHGNARLSQALIIQGGLTAADIVLQQKKPKYRGFIMAALGAATQFGVILPFSRADELEADTLGMQYMSNAGFEPRSAIALWKNMGKLGATPPELLSTHPAPETRIQKIREHLPEYELRRADALKKFPAPACAG